MPFSNGLSNTGMTDIWCCETVYDKGSHPIGFFPIKKIRTSFGKYGNFGSRLYAGEYVESNQLVNLTNTLLSHVMWKGFAHLDCLYILKENKFYLTEVNPRLPGFSYYPSKAGFDMAYYYYADLVGTKYNLPSRYPKSIYFETFLVPGDLVDGIYNMIKGRIAFWPFLRSYLKLFSFGIQKVVDPIKLDEPVVTVLHLLRSLALVAKDVYAFLAKRISLGNNLARIRKKWYR